MKQQAFEQHYSAQWQALARYVNALEHADRSNAPAPVDLPTAYRHLCQHLALARARGYSLSLIQSLEQLTQRTHQHLYKRPETLARQFLIFILEQLPETTRLHWRAVSIAAAALIAPMLSMAWLCHQWPELIYHLLSPHQVEAFEHMYDTNAQRLGAERTRQADSDWMMLGFYIQNNIGIAFQTFAVGILACAGSLFYLLYNGLMIGAVAGYLTQAGHGIPFWGFVAGHSALELTGIVLAGAGGLLLGKAVVAPGTHTRQQALQLAARSAVTLITGAMLMLALAAVVEAFWSSTPAIAPAIKYAVGAASWVAVLSYFSFSGRARHAVD